jgi:hypothetical protein
MNLLEIPSVFGGKARNPRQKANSIGAGNSQKGGGHTPTFAAIRSVTK